MEKLMLEVYSREDSYRLNVDAANAEIIEVIVELIKLMLDQNPQLSEMYILERISEGLDSDHIIKPISEGFNGQI